MLEKEGSLEVVDGIEVNGYYYSYAVLVQAVLILGVVTFATVIAVALVTTRFLIFVSRWSLSCDLDTVPTVCGPRFQCSMRPSRTRIR